MTADPLAALAVAIDTYFEWGGEAGAKPIRDALAADGWHLVNRDTLAAALEACELSLVPYGDTVRHGLPLDALLAEIAGRNEGEPTLMEVSVLPEANPWGHGISVTTPAPPSLDVERLAQTMHDAGIGFTERQVREVAAAYATAGEDSDEAEQR
jgi:hypothetical protein